MKTPADQTAEDALFHLRCKRLRRFIELRAPRAIVTHACESVLCAGRSRYRVAWGIFRDKLLWDIKTCVDAARMRWYVRVRGLPESDAADRVFGLDEP